MEKYKRIFVVVMDSLGVGAMEDSPEFGDVDVILWGISPGLWTVLSSRIFRRWAWQILHR